MFYNRIKPKLGRQNNFRYLIILLLSMQSLPASARLEVCNHSDLVMLVATAFDTAEGHINTEGWWKIYPGTCEIPIDASNRNGVYYLHAESATDTTIPSDSFTWGQEKSLCVSLASDFELADAEFCATDNSRVDFNAVRKEPNNTDKVDLINPARTYLNLSRSKIAGVQRMLSILGYDIGDIDGIAGEKTVEVLHQITLANQLFAFDFEKKYPLLEQLIIDKQFPENRTN